MFLPEVEKRVPEVQGKFLHIIDTLAQDMKRKAVETSYLLASEGTIDSGIYAQCFAPFGIELVNPRTEQYSLLREWIEAVKQNNITDSVIKTFTEFVDGCAIPSLILGCTELPILYANALQTGWKPKLQIFDPLESVITVLKEKYRLMT